MKCSYRTALALLSLLLPVSSIAQVVNEVYAFPTSVPSYGGGMTPAQGRDSKMYGSTSGFGLTNAGGSLVKFSLGGKANVLYTFSQGGTFPSGLTLATDGNFYGTVYDGGTSALGVLFKITAAGSYTGLYNFTGGADGRYPSSAPIQASDGNLYGTTANGTVDDGTIYKYIPSTGTFSTIYSFKQDGSQGSGIVAALMQGADGNLYGTATGGGASGCGVIFKVTISGTLLSDYSFPCGAGGNSPASALIQAADGNLYGTTMLGGDLTSQECQKIGCGTIFKVSHGVVSILYRFSGYPNDGDLAVGGLVEGTDGKLYGGTQKGGSSDIGTLFQISTSGQYKQLYSFVPRIGSGATAALVQHTNGKFYGNASFGGRNNEGAIYSLDMGLGPFIALVRYSGRIGQPVQILGQGLTGVTGVTINGATATSFKVVSDTYMTAVIPVGATTGPVVVTTPKGTLASNHDLRIVQ